MRNKKRRNLRNLLKKNSRGKIIASIFALSIIIILTVISLISFVSSVEAVTDSIPLDSSYIWILQKKTPITGNAVDDSQSNTALVTVKAGEEVGRVRDDFYGVSNYRKFFSENGVYLPGVKKYTNYTWNRQMFLESGMTITRQRAYMNYLFSNNTESFDIKVNDTEQLRQIAEEVKWAWENGNSVMISIVNMPEYLQNRTSGYCNSTQWKSCPPNNLSASNDMIIYLLNNITNNGQYKNVILEVGNEPHLRSLSGSPIFDYGWCNSLPYDDIQRGIEYVKWYNSTYNAIKSNPSLSWVKVIGLAGEKEAPNIIKTFLSNITNNTDGISFHPYGYGETNKLTQYKEVLNLLSLCKIYNANCSNIYLSEWNIGTIFLKNDTSNHPILSNQYAYSYISILNNYPLNVSMIIWDWSETGKYTGYDHWWDMLTQPEWLPLDYPQFQPSYNVTKDFAHYHAGGNMIVNSSSNNNSIKSVASLNPQGIWHITVINTGTNNINVNIDVSSTDVEAIKDLATGTIYPISEGIANVGILTEYDVKHYEGIANYEIEEETPSSVGSTSSDNGNKVVSVKNLNINPNEFASIETGTSKVISTSDIFTYTNTNTNSENNKEEKEEFYGPIQLEQDISDIDYKSRTGSLSLAVSNKSYLTIAIILLGSIICTALIISTIYRKKKREADKVKKLMEWVDKARALGYTPEKMKEMLAQYNWDKELVEKVVGK